MQSTKCTVGTERAVADAIRAARERREPIAPIRGALGDRNIQAAYRVQALNAEAWCRTGHRRPGRKVGLTSTAVQQQLGVDRPDSGVLFDTMAIDNGGTVTASACMQPKVEAEVAFLIGHTLDRDYLRDSPLEEAVACAYPAIEICDSAIARWQIGIVDTIADNASSGFYVLGGPGATLAEFDLLGCKMRMEINGAVASVGVGRACLGSPMRALRWLAETSASLEDPIRAGEVVLSGALGPMATVAPGDRVEAEIEGLGTARVTFGG
ncbi:MAG: fumarylacetoacetate hydrolase family protein [Myxococcota bacterium]